MNVHKCYILLVDDGKAGQGGWGMHAVTRMQVTGLMLNRCDSMQERQTQSSLIVGWEIQPKREQELDTPLRSLFFRFSR